MRVQLTIAASMILLILAADWSSAQQPNTETAAVAAALRHVREQLPPSSRIAFEVRTRDPRAEGSQFDQSRSQAVAAGLGNFQVGRTEDVLSCSGRPDSCRLSGADALLTVWQVSSAADAESPYEVYVDIRESQASDRRPVHWKRVVLTVERSTRGASWTVTNMRTLAMS